MPTVDLAIERGSDQVSPCPRHDANQSVSAAADCQPPALGVAVGKIAHCQERCALAVDGQSEIRERILAVTSRLRTG